MTLDCHTIHRFLVYARILDPLSKYATWHKLDSYYEKPHFVGHRSGGVYTEKPIVLYEYQKIRNHKHSEAFYKSFRGVLVTDGLHQYHMLGKRTQINISIRFYSTM